MCLRVCGLGCFGRSLPVCPLDLVWGGGVELVHVFSFYLENMESEVSMGIAGDAVCRC
jgi:hypothetical protein